MKTEPDNLTPALSAIVVMPDSRDTIARLVDALRAQTARKEMELVLVTPFRAQVEARLADFEGFCGWRIVDCPKLGTLARAKAAGVHAAIAPVVVMTEDHAFPQPDWAQALIDAHRGDWAAVGPAIDNANPESLVSWADFVLGYGPWLNPAKAGEVDELPGHNSSYKRKILLSCGSRLEELLAAESVLHEELRNRGFRLCLEPRARTAHTNFTHIAPWVLYLFHSGRVHAAERANRWSYLRRTGYSAGAFLIPLVRFKRLWPHIRRGRPELVPRLLGPLFFALTTDAIGQCLGFTLGAGRSAEKLVPLEFHRNSKARPN